MTDILVIKVNAFLSRKDMNDLTKYIHESMKTGLVVLPPYCDAQIVPEDVEVHIENPYDLKGENSNVEN